MNPFKVLTQSIDRNKKMVRIHDKLLEYDNQKKVVLHQSRKLKRQLDDFISFLEGIAGEAKEDR